MQNFLKLSLNTTLYLTFLSFFISALSSSNTPFETVATLITKYSLITFIALFILTVKVKNIKF